MLSYYIFTHNVKLQSSAQIIITLHTYLGTIFILRKVIGVGGWVGGPENGNFPLLYVKRNPKIKFSVKSSEKEKAD